MKRLVALLMALCMLLAFAACGASETPATDTSAVSANSTSADVGGIKRGGNLTLRRVGITPINPTTCIAPAGDMMTYSLFFETLTWLNEDDFTAQPNLAADWEWSEDNLHLEITLVENAFFFDGTPVNAEAVKATFEFYTDEQYKHAQASYLAKLESVEVVSDYVARFNFSAPDSSFLNAMSQPVGIILSPSAIEEFKISGNAEVFARQGGCGPFILSEFIDGESLTALKNGNYYRIGEDGQPLPYLDSVTVQIVADESVMAANLQSGDIDVVDFSIDQTVNETLAANNDIVLYEIAAKTQYILYMNTTKAPFDNILVREALNYAFDRQELIDVMAGGNGFTTPTIVLPSQTFYRDGKQYGYEPETAKALLAEAGYPDGVDIDLYFGTYGSLQELCELLQAQAKEAGFSINLQPTDGATVKQLWASYDDNAPSGIRINDLGHPKASPYIQMEYTFGPTALQNCAKYFRSDFQELLAKTSSTTDAAELDETLIEMQAMIEEDIPLVSLYTAARFSAYRTWVEGIKYNGDGTMVFTNVWLNK